MPSSLTGVLTVQVFALLQRKGHQPALNEWAVLSVSSFLQRVPRSLAISSLACLFISVSRDKLIRSLIDYVAYQTEVRAEDILRPCHAKCAPLCSWK